jgi:hypothetical protein
MVLCSSDGCHPQTLAASVGLLVLQAAHGLDWFANPTEANKMPLKQLGAIQG